MYFQPYRKAFTSYETLREYVDRDVAFFAIQVERLGLNELATMHTLPFFGNDIYAVEKPRGFAEIDPITGQPKRDVIYNPGNVRLFDKHTLAVKHITAVPFLVNELSKEYSRDPVIPTMLHNYVEATDKDLYEILSAFSKISELNSSSSEFKTFQKYIDENAAKEYLNEKPLLKKTLTEVTGNQSKLD